MKTITLTFVALTTVVLVGLAAKPSNAAGFGLYVSSGYPSYYYSYYSGPGFYGGGYGHYDDCYEDVYHGDVWHDTSHYHYRPARIVRHGSHFHYQPSRYELHRTGHWDHVHW